MWGFGRMWGCDCGVRVSKPRVTLGLSLKLWEPRIPPVANEVGVTFLFHRLTAPSGLPKSWPCRSLVVSVANFPVTLPVFYRVILRVVDKECRELALLLWGR